MSNQELPQVVKDTFQKLMSKFEVTEEQLQSEYMKVFNEPFIQNDKNFKDDLDRHRYASRRLYVLFMSKPRENSHVVIPYGFDSVRLTKREKKPWTKIHALVKDQNGKWEKKRIICNNEQTILPKSLNLLNMYETSFSESSFGNALQATPQTSFVAGKPLPNVTTDNLAEFITNKLGAKQITIADSAQNLSKLQEGSKYVDETDLRLIQAFVMHKHVGVKEDGTEFGVYNISDGTIENDKMVGNIAIPQQLSAFAHPSLVMYSEGSECLFLGTISAYNNQVSMNAIAVFPIHAQLAES